MTNKHASPRPLWLRIWFFLGTFQRQPGRSLLIRLERILHGFGLFFCLLGLINEAALAGGLLLLINGYFISYCKYMGDKFAIW
ncbi:MULTISPECIES: hypothetical protein [Pseudoalteromonas]|nr:MULTISPECIES: hypothetical protein [Pseudoalteromonas]